ncbi:MAG TPA: hypothetical protein ENI33_08185 [Thermoplasmatales archaeon]|nr:hypothetical protein [Thermoplasmatales archaeon]
MKRFAVTLISLMLFLPVAYGSWLPPLKISEEISLPRPTIASYGKEIFIFWKGKNLTYCTIEDKNITSYKVLQGVNVDSYSLYFDGRNFHILYSSNGSLHYISFNKEGHILRRASLNTISAIEPDLVVDNKGNIHMVWSEDRGDGYQIYYGVKPNETGANFSEKKLTSSNLSSRRPKIGVDGNGFVHILYDEASPNIRRVGYFEIRGGEVVTEKILKEENAYWTAFDIDKKNILHIVWQDGLCGKANIYYMEMGQNASSIYKKIISKGDDKKPDIAVDSNGVTHIVWNTDKELFYARIDEEKNVKVEKIVSIKDPRYPSITLDYNLTPYVVFERWEGGEKPYSLYYTYKTGEEEEKNTPLFSYLPILAIIFVIYIINKTKKKI